MQILDGKTGHGEIDMRRGFGVAGVGSIASAQQRVLDAGRPEPAASRFPPSSWRRITDAALAVRRGRCRAK